MKIGILFLSKVEDVHSDVAQVQFVLLPHAEDELDDDGHAHVGDVGHSREKVERKILQRHEDKQIQCSCRWAEKMSENFADFILSEKHSYAALSETVSLSSINNVLIVRHPFVRLVSAFRSMSTFRL